MSLLVRPYPVASLGAAREAMTAAAEGDLVPMATLYREARDALAGVDPDEVQEILRAHPKIARAHKATKRAAQAVADEWEGIVTLGAEITDPFDFRAFTWSAAGHRYELGGSYEEFAEGLDFPGVLGEDAALYVALPALIGLGPEFPEEVLGPCPLDGIAVAELLGMDANDVAGIDPLDGTAVSAETLRAHLPSLTGPWRDLAVAATGRGLLVRSVL